MTKLTAAKIKNTTNKTYAICVAVPAMPDNPSNPAMIATTRNVTAQLSIVTPFVRTGEARPIPKFHIPLSGCRSQSGAELCASTLSINRGFLSSLETDLDFLSLAFAIGVAKNCR